MMYIIASKKKHKQLSNALIVKFSGEHNKDKCQVPGSHVKTAK